MIYENGFVEKLSELGYSEKEATQLLQAFKGIADKGLNLAAKGNLEAMKLHANLMGRFPKAMDSTHKFIEGLPVSGVQGLTAPEVLPGIGLDVATQGAVSGAKKLKGLYSKSKASRMGT